MKVNKFTVGAPNPFKENDLTGGYNNIRLQGHIVEVKGDKGPDGKSTFRAKVRLLGLQDDQGRISDENLQWFDVMLPPNSFNSTPFLKPGDMVMVANFGGAPGSMTSAYVEGLTNRYPPSPTLQGESASKTWMVPSAEDRPKPRKSGDKKRAYEVTHEDITDKKGTQETGQHKYNRITSTDTSENVQRDKMPNRYDENKTRYVAEKTTGAHKYDAGKDAQKFIQKAINNEGAFVPSALQMIQQLKQLGNGQNPNSINAVGASNFMNGLKELKSHFSKQQPRQENPCVLLETNPEALSQEQITKCCSPENRRNLTPKQKEYCEYLESLQAMAEEETEVTTS